MFQVNESLAGVWGLDASREYTQAEIDASEHLQWARRAGALVSPETVVPEPAAPQVFEIDLRDGVDAGEASAAGKTLSRAKHSPRGERKE